MRWIAFDKPPIDNIGILVRAYNARHLRMRILRACYVFSQDVLNKQEGYKSIKACRESFTRKNKT